MRQFWNEENLHIRISTYNEDRRINIRKSSHVTLSFYGDNTIADIDIRNIKGDFLYQDGLHEKILERNFIWALNESFKRNPYTPSTRNFLIKGGKSGLNSLIKICKQST